MEYIILYAASGLPLFVSKQPRFSTNDQLHFFHHPREKQDLLIFFLGWIKPER